MSAGYQSLVTDYNTLNAAAASNNQVALATDCDVVSADAQRLQSDPPVPDATLNSLWQTAMTSYALGGRDCAAGIGVQDPQEFEAAITQMSTATSSLDQFAARLRQEGVSA